MLPLMHALHHRSGKDTPVLVIAAASLSSAGAIALLVPLIMACVFAPALQAAEITPEQSLLVCRNWLELYSTAQSAVSGGINAPSSDRDHVEAVRRTPIPEAAWDLVHDGRPVARCYPLHPRGHIIVAANNHLPPVPAFSMDADLDPQLSPALVQALAERLAISLDEPASGRPERIVRIRSSWEMLGDPLFDPGKSLPAGSQRLSQGGPLLTSLWHQSGPFSIHCPMGDGGRTKVGCGPLAMAQVMHYHEWPPYGVGTVEYFWEGDTSCGGQTEGAVLSADLTNPYAWEAMPDHCLGGCSPEEMDVVAELCYEVGVACGARYGVCGTAIGTDTARRVLAERFRYSTDRTWQFRGQMTRESWHALVRRETDLGRPMLYYVAGRPAHLMVCDGWMELGSVLRIHVNWGDGGAPYSGWWDVDGLPGDQNPTSDRILAAIRPLCEVAADGSGFFATIQEALDSAPAGAVIELRDGIYEGPGNHDLEIRGINIEIRSAGGVPELCILDCGGSQFEPRRAFRFGSGESGNIVVRNLTIRNGYQGIGGAVLCENGSSPLLESLVLESNTARAGGAIASVSSYPRLHGVRFEGNHADIGGALHLDGGDFELSECVFTDNRALEKGGVAYVREGGLSIASSTLFHNHAPEGSSLYAGRNAGLDLRRCLVAGGVGGGAIGADEGASLGLSCCNLFDNEGGNWVGPIAPLGDVDGNMEADPLFCGPDEGDLGLHFLSPCAENNNEECGQIGAFGTACGAGAVIAVRADGGGLYPTIQAAVDAAFDGVVIELAPGVYSGIGNREVRVLGKQLEFRGQTGDPADCVLDCSSEGSQRHRAFLVGNTDGGTVTFSGLTIRNGAVGSVLDPGEIGGGAVRLQGADAEFIDCVFEGNSGVFPGGDRGHGGAVLGQGAAVSITRCRFSENQAVLGGAVAIVGGSLTMDDCEFLHNYSAGDGGAIHLGRGEAGITGCVFAGNEAAGRGGSLYIQQGSASVMYGTFFRSRAPEGSGVYSELGSAVELRHCIIAGGYDGAAVGGSEGTDMALACCSIFGNEGGDWAGPIEDLLGVDGNIEADPLFCDPDVHDLGLHFLSPCAEVNNPGCGRIGAAGVSCGAGSVVVLHPDASGPYPTIQAAVDAAVDGVVLELAPGVYTGPGNRDVRVVGKQLEFRGQTGDPADCVLDCQGDGDRRHRAFLVSGDAGGQAVVFRGLTIRHGEAARHISPGLDGGVETGIHGAVDDTVVVEVRGGGAVMIQGVPAGFYDCVFEHNSGFTAPGDSLGKGGAVLGLNTALSFTRCRFSGNQAAGGGALSIIGGSLELVDCGFDANEAGRGGAVFADGPSTLEARNCTFAWNRAAQGGALCGPDEPHLAGCTFFGNEAGEGSAFFGPAGCLRISQTLIAGGSGGAAVVCSDSSCHEIGCTDIFGNAGGDWTGILAQYLGLDGNIGIDPVLCEPDSGDFRLRTDSPCAPFQPPNSHCGLIGAWSTGCEPDDDDDPVGSRVLLSRPQPNPSAGSVQFMCDVLVADTPVPLRMRIHDVSGRRVWQMKTELSAGRHTLEWHGLDSSGRRVPSGVYMVRIEAGRLEVSDRVVLLR